MATVLVVDDSSTDRMIAGRLLQKHSGLIVSYAEDGNQALEAIRRETPDVVVTDLQMPECDGLQLVDAVKHEFPRLPVVLMTAQGSEEIAAEALRKGASSYVPKRALATLLLDTVARILTAAAADRQQSRLMHSLAECDCRFVLQNDPELLESLTTHLQEMLRCLPLGDESERLRVGLAVKHALLNGLYHGNLELPLGTDDLQSAAAASQVAERFDQSPYADRTLMLEARISPVEAMFTVHHEGPGFPATACDLDHPDVCATQHFARGLVLMQSIMDEVEFAADGRTITLTKYAAGEAELCVDD
ncbi:MAG TPA: response regulator [Planctomycetaceae bacterium]|nr:response regulator [Planctomycetaceae bacterium]